MPRTKSHFPNQVTSTGNLIVPKNRTPRQVPTRVGIDLYEKSPRSRFPKQDYFSGKHSQSLEKGGLRKPGLKHPVGSKFSEDDAHDYSQLKFFAGD